MCLQWLCDFSIVRFLPLRLLCLIVKILLTYYTKSISKIINTKLDHAEPLSLSIRLYNIELNDLISGPFGSLISGPGCSKLTTLLVNIGIKHGFSCINVCQVPREVLKTEAEGRGFQHLPRDLANVNVLENHV